MRISETVQKAAVKLGFDEADCRRLAHYFKPGAANSCWHWGTAARSQNRYGNLRAMGRQWPAHRLIWQLLNGPIEDGLFMRHTCGNRSCVNPAHLAPGNAKDNATDRIVLHDRGTKPKLVTRSVVMATRFDSDEAEAMRLGAIAHDRSTAQLLRLGGLYLAGMKSLELLDLLPKIRKHRQNV